MAALLRPRGPFGEYPTKLYVLPQVRAVPVPQLHILRMRVASPFEALKLPDTLKFLEEAICHFATRAPVWLPWVYVTVRHGDIKELGDDVWHVDGYSMRTPHPPEVDYIWSDHTPTEFLVGRFEPPAAFNPLKHDLALWLQSRAANGHVFQGEARCWYSLSPYVVHRRPAYASAPRTFLRISFLPIEIVDDVQTQNPLLEDRRRPNGFRASLTRLCQ